MSNPKSVLHGVRVLDLCDHTGVFCTKMLASLGAEVIKVERPGGDPARRLSPFFKGEPHPERSLHWWLYNMGKKSITLDIEKTDGAKIFRRLIRDTDILVETTTPGYLDKLSLDYPHLSRLNSGLIHTAITPFGRTGPHAGYKGGDLVLNSMGGLAFQCGAPDTSPTNMSVPAVFVMAGTQAAGATLAASFYRQLSGEGQFVDVSIQEAVIWTQKPWDVCWKAEGVFPSRGGDSPVVPGHPKWRMYYEAADGYVCASPNYASHREDMRRWLKEEGLVGDLLSPKYDSYFRGEPRPDNEAMEQKVSQAFEILARRYPKERLYHEAERRGVQVAPVNTPADLLKDAHLLARNYFTRLDHPEEGMSLRYQGAPIAFGETPCRLDTRAPRIGEHNHEVFVEELGLTPAELVALAERGVI